MSNGNIRLSIEDILNLNYNVSNYPGICDEITRLVTNQITDNFIPLDNIGDCEIREYVVDYCNDCRSRAVDAVYYKNVPILIYQIIGKGSTRNIHVLNENYFNEFKDKVISYVVREFEEEYAVSDLYDVIVLENYNNGRFVIEDNTLFSMND